MLLGWGFCVLQRTSQHRNFLEVFGWPSVNLNHSITNLTQHRRIRFRCKLSNSFSVLDLCPPILRLWLLRFSLTIDLLLFSREDFFIVADALMAFSGLTRAHWDFFFFNYLFIIYFWLCWVFVSVPGLSPVAASGGHSSLRCAGLSLSRPLLLRSTGSRRAGSVVVAYGPSCSAACGIFPDQGSNPCALHWQADSQPLCHQGSPPLRFWYATGQDSLNPLSYFPMSPVLAGILSTTAPPGKPRSF